VVAIFQEEDKKMDFYLVRNAFQGGRYEIRDSFTRLEVAVGDTPPLNLDKLIEQCCKVCGLCSCAVHANWIICSCSGKWKYDPLVHKTCPGCGTPPPNLSANQGGVAQKT
jgi:hypothetical protein